MSIKKKLVLSFTVLVFSPVFILFIFSNTYTGNILIQRISSANTDSLIGSAKRMDRLMDDITYALLGISHNAQLMEIMRDDVSKSMGSNPDIVMEKISKVNNILDSVPPNMLMYSAKITVLCDSGKSYGTWDNFFIFSESIRTSEWYNDMIKSHSGNIQWLGIKNSFGTNANENSYVLEAAIPVRQSRSSINNIGIIHIAIPEKEICSAIMLEGTESEIFLVGSKGGIMSFKDKKYINTGLYEYLGISHSYNGMKDGWFIEKSKDSKKMVISVSSLNKTDWKLVSVIPYDKMLAPLNNFNRLIIIVNLIFIASFIFVALVISNSISRPIIELNDKMKRISQGNLDVHVDILYEDEIGNMSMNFNNMLLRIKELLTLTEKQERMKREAELKALQAQVNPHFLFNTLSSMRWTAAAANDKKVEEMALALSNLLKYSINKGPDMICLEEEINMLKHYIALFQIKYESVISLDLAFEEEMLKIKIPRLLLQPIVENSIIHGFEGNNQDNRISIEGRFNEDYFIIEIVDNGKGVDTVILDELMNKPNAGNDNIKFYSSIGIKNVDERIKLNFGDKYGINVKNGRDIGTIVTLMLPSGK
jgi:Predicted signal transduction protein with a C-terminal ATPase domain